MDDFWFQQNVGKITNTYLKTPHVGSVLDSSVALNTLYEQLCKAQQEYYQMLQQSFQLKLDILNCPESEHDVKEAEQHALDNTVEYIRKAREKLQQQLTSLLSSLPPQPH
ncbi:hypothetical protein QOT17_001302 [Balamuthia mandrillaris]